MTDMTNHEAVEVLRDSLVTGRASHSQERQAEAIATLSALADRAGDDRKGFRTEGMATTFAEYLTETPQDVTYKRLVELGWTPPAAPGASHAD